MKKNGLTISVILEAESANYGEGFGNIAILKKMTRSDGRTYTYISRQALRYNIVEQLGWDTTPVKPEGSGDKKVVQFHPDATIEEYPEIDLFGYMKTKKKGKGTDGEDEKGGADTRPAVARLSHAIALEPFQSDLDFMTNMGLAHRVPGTQNNIAQSEIHRSLYAYTLAVDLDRVGIDGDIELPAREKADRVKALLTAIQYLYRDIKGRRENLAPVFVVGGIYERKNPFFENRLRLSHGKLNVDMIVQAMAPVKEDTVVGCLAGAFQNDVEITKALDAVTVEEAFDLLRKKVEEAYESH